MVRFRTRVISLITAEVVLTPACDGLSGSLGTNEPLFHMAYFDSGSREGSWSSEGPGMPSSANAVNVNGSTASPGASVESSSAAMRWSSLSATGSSVALPVLRWEMRVASSWKATYAIECSASSSCALA